MVSGEMPPVPPQPEFLQLTEPLGDHYESPGCEAGQPGFDEVLHGDRSHGINAGGGGAEGPTVGTGQKEPRDSRQVLEDVQHQQGHVLVRGRDTPCKERVTVYIDREHDDATASSAEHNQEQAQLVDEQGQLGLLLCATGHIALHLCLVHAIH